MARSTRGRVAKSGRQGPRGAKRKARTPPAATTRRTSAQVNEYSEFVIRAERVSISEISVQVVSAPAGAMPDAVRIPFPDRDAQHIRDGFRISTNDPESGRALIQPEEAIALGQRLSEVLLPSPVFNCLAENLGAALERKHAGLRVRLDLDASLIDLPWEYLYRPDRRHAGGISGFLLYDQAISLVRCAADKRRLLAPISGVQRLNFIGSLWAGGHDTWGVREEFGRLTIALKPVSRFITTHASMASDADVFDAGLTDDTAFFHYAGHCDFDRTGRPFCVREMPPSGSLDNARKAWIDELAARIEHTQTRIVVLSACNSGFWPVVQPIIDAGVPAVIGINGGVASQSTIEFCAKLYESLALGLTLDESVARARLAVMEFGASMGLFDWGLYMVYMTSPNAALFPRAKTASVATSQANVRREHRIASEQSVDRVRQLDGMNFGQITSELVQHRVLILGRFTERRLKILELIKRRLAKHKQGYVGELFTFDRPDARDLVESILAFACLSRFIIADLSEPKSVPQELQAIAPNLQSVPIVPIINEGGREFATFAGLARRPNVVQPTTRYRDVKDLEVKLIRDIIPAAEKRRLEMRPA